MDLLSEPLATLDWLEKIVHKIDLLHVVAYFAIERETN